MALRVPNVIDLHCHYGPDTAGADLAGVLTGHGVTALEAAREAAASGHAAIVLKSHSFASTALATALDDAVPGIGVFGGICTDFPTGGLNVAAVEIALALGAKIVWLPAVHSWEDVSRGRRPYLTVPGIAVIDDDFTPPRCGSRDRRSGACSGCCPRDRPHLGDRALRSGQGVR